MNHWQTCSSLSLKHDSVSLLNWKINVNKSNLTWCESEHISLMFVNTIFEHHRMQLTHSLSCDRSAEDSPGAVEQVSVLAVSLIQHQNNFSLRLCFLQAASPDHSWITVGLNSPGWWSCVLEQSLRGTTGMWFDPEKHRYGNSLMTKLKTKDWKQRFCSHKLFLQM